ncbi:MAG TPA: hypothetical protein VL281_10075 [Mycobacteriales bacterium]|nr:hypothetical protein [Mycobacteriales bacterium]
MPTRREHRRPRGRVPPFDNVVARRALAFALDRGGISQLWVQ